MTRSQQASVFALLLLTPALLYILAIVAYPLVDTLNLSFTNAGLPRVYHWIGGANYQKIFNPTFAMVIGRTFLWTFCSVMLKMIIGTCGAVLLNAAVPGQAIFRMLTLPPWIIPMAIGIFMWGWMYNGQFGMISGLLQEAHIIDHPLPWLAYGDTAFFATLVTDTWIGVPLVTLYFLAAIQAIPKDLYEAAWADGAGRWYRFRRITLPLMMPAVISMSVLSLITTFNSFDIIWILTQGGPNGSTTTMIIDTYRTAIGSYKYGEGAARAVLICIFLGIFCVLYLRITRRISQGSAA